MKLLLHPLHVDFRFHFRVVTLAEGFNLVTDERVLLCHPLRRPPPAPMFELVFGYSFGLTDFPTSATGVRGVAGETTRLLGDQRS